MPDAKKENHAKKYLQQYRKAVIAERCAREGLAETRDRMTSIRGALSGVGNIRGTADGDILARMLVDYEREELRLLRKIKICYRVRWKVKRCINRVEPAGLHKVMKLRYMQGLSWERIASVLYCDRTTALRWHGNALVYLSSKKSSTQCKIKTSHKR